MGCPYRDRVDRVRVSRESLGLDSKMPVMSFLPGAALIDAQQNLPFMEQVAELMKQRIPQIQLVMPMTGFLFQKAHKGSFDAKKIRVEALAAGQRERSMVSSS